MKTPTANTPRISILLPTRGRTTALETSLISLAELADDAARVEMLLAFDDDDAVGYDYFDATVSVRLDELGVSYTAFQFPRLGYIRLNEYVNALAKQSRGDWLMFWGDDAVMESQGWDSTILEVPDFRVLRMPTHKQHPYAIFPIVPRAWVETLGYISAHQLSDSWVSQIAYLLNIMQNIPVSVTHDRFDITGNNNDDTYKNRPMLEGNHRDPRDFNHESWRNIRMADCERLAILLASQGQDTSWWQNVKLGQQDPWEYMLSVEQDPNKQMSKIKK